MLAVNIILTIKLIKIEIKKEKENHNKKQRRKLYNKKSSKEKVNLWRQTDIVSGLID